MDSIVNFSCSTVPKGDVEFFRGVLTDEGSNFCGYLCQLEAESLRKAAVSTACIINTTSEMGIGYHSFGLQFEDFVRDVRIAKFLEELLLYIKVNTLVINKSSVEVALYGISRADGHSAIESVSDQAQLDKFFAKYRLDRLAKFAVCVTIRKLNK